MGWRGALRSINAANNKAARNKEQMLRAADKAHRKLDQIGDKFQNEYSSEICKLNALQEAFKKAPLSKTGVEFDESVRKFKFNPIKGEKGEIKYSINLSWEPSAMLPDARQLEVDGHFITLEALCFTQFATYVAFKIERIPGVIQDINRLIIV
jgi:hypothetical protein